MSEPLTLSAFTNYLNESFTLKLDSSNCFELVLVKATALKTSDQEHQPFAIEFRGSKEVALQQQIYSFEHAQMGTFELFIVPVGDDQDYFYYEAVFN